MARACLVSGERPVAQARREEGSAERVLADEAGRALEQLERRARLELRHQLGRRRRHAAAQRALQRRALAAVVRGQVAQAELARDAARLGVRRVALVLEPHREQVELGRGEHHHPVGGGHRAAAEAKASRSDLEVQGHQGGRRPEVLGQVPLGMLFRFRFRFSVVL